MAIFGGQETPYGFFAQDDWKVKPNLSLTLSIRWDDFTNHTAWGPDFQFSNLILASGSTFAQQIAGATVRPVSGVIATPPTISGVRVSVLRGIRREPANGAFVAVLARTTTGVPWVRLWTRCVPIRRR